MDLLELESLRDIEKFYARSTPEFNHQEAQNEISESQSEGRHRRISQKLLDKRHVMRFAPPPNIFGSDNLGELGKPVTMPDKLPPEIKAIYDEGWNSHQFNQYLSDLISVNRSLPDGRSDYCKNEATSYSKNLPATSVIIIFHNEAWSTLIRSVHSVLNRSPEHLIAEVILVDDFSDMGE